MSAVERLRSSAVRKLLVDDGLAVSLAAFLSVGGLALANGGYFPVSWGWSSVGLLALAFVALAVGVGTRPGVLSVVLLAFLAGLTIWTAVSAVWTLDETKTVNEVERGIVYLAAAGSVLVLVRKCGERAVLVGVWAAIAVVSVYGLAIWLFPQYLGYEDPGSRYRLSAPVGYWNAFGVLAAIGALLALGLAARGKVVLRCLAAASTVLILITLYFTFSRGGWIAFAAGLVVAIALDRRRLQLLTTAFVLAPWPILGIWVASRSEALTHSNSPLDAVAKDGHGLAGVVILLAAAAGFAILLFDTAESRVRIPRGAVWAYGAVMALVVVVGVSAVFAEYGSPVTLARKAYHSFNADAPATNGALNNRLFSLSGNGRSPQFHTAWQEVEAYPWLGSGAGTFDIYWFQHRQVRGTIHDVHNLYLETLAELGPVGLLLLIGVLVVPVVAAVRARGHPLAAVAFGAYVAFLLHAAVDWDWEMPTVTLAGLFCGLALLARLKGDGPERPLPRVVRAAGLW